MKHLSDADAERALEVYGLAIQHLEAKGMERATCLTAMAGLLVTGITDLAGPQVAARYLRDLADVIEARGKDYQRLLGKRNGQA